MEKLRKHLYYIILYIFVKGVLIKFLGNKDVFDLLTDVLVFYIAYKAPRGIKGETRGILGTGVVWACGVFLFVGLLADLINIVPPLTVLWGLRLMVRYFLLFYAIVKLCDQSDADTFRELIYRVFKWNVMACVIEFLLGIKGDTLGGTFVGNGQLVVFFVMCLLLFSIDYYEGLQSQLNFAIQIVLIFVIAMWAEIKFLYFLTPICAYTGYVLVKKFTFGHLIALVLAYFLLIPVMQYTLSFYYSEEYIEKVFDQQYIEEETTSDGYNLSAVGRSFNRGTCIEKANQLLLIDPIHYSVGYGIGSGTNSGTFRTWINERYRDTAYFFFTSSYVLIETGWIGYVAFLLIYLFITVRFARYYLRQDDEYVRYWAALGFGMGIFTFMLIWYNDQPYVNYFLPFMLWAFCFLAVERKKFETEAELVEENKTD